MKTRAKDRSGRTGKSDTDVQMPAVFVGRSTMILSAIVYFLPLFFTLHSTDQLAAHWYK
jgi:hypothetical protein